VARFNIVATLLITLSIKDRNRRFSFRTSRPGDPDDHKNDDDYKRQRGSQRNQQVLKTKISDGYHCLSSAISVSKKPCAGRHRRSSHTLTETMTITAQDFKVLNGCDCGNGKGNASGPPR